jgi:YopT peptidase
MASAKWLECHAKGDHMANWLQKDGTGPIDPNKIRQLMQLFSVGTTMHPDRMRGGSGGGADDQNRATEVWLATKGIIRKGAIVGVPFHNMGLVHVPQGSNVPRGDRRRRVLARALAEEIVRHPGTYKMIGMNGTHFAHACAAWSQRDVAFFDPNFGEFWFDTREKFVSWFPTFWHTAGYGTPKIGLSEGYETWEYYCPLKAGAA